MALCAALNHQVAKRRFNEIAFQKPFSGSKFELGNALVRYGKPNVCCGWALSLAPLADPLDRPLDLLQKSSCKKTLNAIESFSAAINRRGSAKL